MRILLFGIFLLVTASSFAQKASQKASADVCECVEKKLPATEQQHVKDTVNRCFGHAMAVHMDELNKEFKVTAVTVESIMKTRDRLLKILKKKCVYFKS